MALQRPMSRYERRAAVLSALVICLGSGMAPVAAQLPRTTGTLHATVIAALIGLVAAIATLSLLAGGALRAARHRHEPLPPTYRDR